MLERFTSITLKYWYPFPHTRMRMRAGRVGFYNTHQPSAKAKEAIDSDKTKTFFPRPTTSARVLNFQKVNR